MGYSGPGCEIGVRVPMLGVGDSNGSGEGNPPFFFPQCDRIEDHDPRSSVTFVFTTCSGARTDLYFGPLMRFCVEQYQTQQF